MDVVGSRWSGSVTSSENGSANESQNPRKIAEKVVELLGQLKQSSLLPHPRRAELEKELTTLIKKGLNDDAFTHSEIVAFFSDIEQYASVTTRNDLKGIAIDAAGELLQYYEESSGSEDESSGATVRFRDDMFDSACTMLECVKFFKSPNGIDELDDVGTRLIMLGSRDSRWPQLVDIFEKLVNQFSPKCRAYIELTMVENIRKYIESCEGQPFQVARYDDVYNVYDLLIEHGSSAIQRQSDDLLTQIIDMGKKGMDLAEKYLDTQRYNDAAPILECLADWGHEGAQKVISAAQGVLNPTTKESQAMRTAS